MGRPYRPLRELEGHLGRGELDFAIASPGWRPRSAGGPLDLGLMLRFLPLVAVQRPEAFDVWALRWLERWCRELSGAASVDEAIEVAEGLAEIPVDPESGLRRIRSISDRHA